MKFTGASSDESTVLTTHPTCHTLTLEPRLLGIQGFSFLPGMLGREACRGQRPAIEPPTS